VSYDRLELEHARTPKRVVDHSARWNQLQPVSSVNGDMGGRIASFCEAKRISVEALAALGTRVWSHGKGPDVCLAWGYRNGDAVVGVKWRNVGNGERQAWPPSTFPQPLLLGNLDSLDWLLAEGETDACRLFDLVGDSCAVACLPAGAKTFRREWAARIPRGATVHLCHDADEAGDEGAAKAAAILGGRTVRVRPPDGFGDWCEWPGDRDEFVRLVAACRSASRSFEFVSLDEFVAHPFPAADPLLGEPGRVIVAVGSLLLVYGAEGSGKSTFTVDAVAHMAAGLDWLGIPVPRPVRFCLVENEGPPALFQAKLDAKRATWEGPDFSENVFVYADPWGEFSFADPAARDALNAFCEEHTVDVVVANPTLGLGVAGSGRPDETQLFVDWLVECGLKSVRAFWLLHHENKAGQISGDWGRHPDTKVQLQPDGNQPRTKLLWEKTRWATLPADVQPKACILEWVVETAGYTVIELEIVGASDSELEQRLDDFLEAHPLSSTTAVCKGVQGTNRRLQILLAESDKYDSVKGPRGAKLWFLPSTLSQPPTEEPTG
jgi:AAA domain